MSNPKCIVCGKPIAKRMGYVSFMPATLNGRENGDRKDSTIYLDDELRPNTKEEAQKYTNYPITRVDMSNGRVYAIRWWDGVSYMDDFFHSQTCAAQQGYASAQHGHRYTWSDK